MSLSSPKIDANNLEGSALALWNEFLGNYFDGGSHLVGPKVTVQFPVASLRFQEAPQPQPLKVNGASAVGISVVFIAPAKVSTEWDALTPAEIAAVPGGNTANKRQERAYARCAFLFMVRATIAGNGTDNSQGQAQSAAGKLYGLLSNSGETSTLAEKGIAHLHHTPPRMAFQGQGAPDADMGYRLRVISCAATLRWPIVSQEPGL